MENDMPATAALMGTGRKMGCRILNNLNHRAFKSGCYSSPSSSKSNLPNCRDECITVYASIPATHWNTTR